MSAITYLLQVSGCITLFYAFYYACLSRLTFFSINRYYLVSSLLLSFIIPLITIPVYTDYTVLTNTRVVQLPQVIATIAKPSAVFHPIILKHSPITWVMVLKWVYMLGCALLSLRFLFTLAAFFLNLRKQKVEHSDGLHIIRSDKKLTNGSFLNYIFLDDAKLKGEEAQQVIAHEILHVRLKHSVDRIAGRVAQIILWFNPVMYLYTRAIEQNHEFEVDSILTENLNKKNYAGLLLQLSVNTNGTIYNSFSKTPLQQRIMMLFNARSSKVKQAVYLLVIPLLMLSCVAFANLKRIVVPKALNHSVTLVPKQLYRMIEPQAVVQPEETKTDVAQSVATINNESAESANTDVDTLPRLSVIDGLEKLGKSPLVIIDGKEYPSDILYTIGRSCIRGTGIWLPDSALKYYGPRAKDGYVQITTKNGQITDQTNIERSNLVTENMPALTQTDNRAVITRTLLQKKDGDYDRVAELQDGITMLEIEVHHNAKVAFFIDSAFYTEEQIRTILPEKVNTLGSRGVGYLNKKKVPGGDLHGYEAVMFFFSQITQRTSSPKEMKVWIDSHNWEKHIPLN